MNPPVARGMVTTDALSTTQFISRTTGEKPQLAEYQVGPQRLLLGLFRIPRVSQHQGIYAQCRRHPDGSADHATVGPELPDLRLAHGTGRTMRPVVRLAVVERPAVHEGAAAAFRQATAYNIRVNRAQRLIEAGP